MVVARFQEDTVHEVNERMLDFVRAALPSGDWSAPVEAERILDTLPTALLNEWLTVNTHAFIVGLLGDLRQHERRDGLLLRTVARRAGAFARYQEDGGSVRSVLDTRFVVNDQHLSRRLGDMTKADLHYVRDRYASSAQDATVKAEFLDDLANRTPEGQTVAEALGEQTVRDVLAHYFVPAPDVAVA